MDKVWLQSGKTSMDKSGLEACFILHPDSFENNRHGKTVCINIIRHTASILNPYNLKSLESVWM